MHPLSCILTLIFSGYATRPFTMSFMSFMSGLTKAESDEVNLNFRSTTLLVDSLDVTVPRDFVNYCIALVI